MKSRLLLTVTITTIAAAAWGIAFVLFNRHSLADAWQAHTQSRSPLILTACFVVACSTIVLYLKHFLPGRLVSALLIGLVAATLINNATSTSRRDRKKLVSQDRFVGFKQTTIRYVAFCSPLIIACAIATRRSNPSCQTGDNAPKPMTN